MTITNRFQNFTMTLPEKGPMSVPDFWDFSANEKTEIDLTQLTEMGWMEYISGVYIDNTENSGSLVFECSGTNQRFTFPAYYSGYVPLFLPNPPKVFVTSTEAALVRFQWYNVPVFPLLIPGPNAGIATDNVNITAIAGIPLVDPELPVIGPVTNTELLAAELATEAKQDAIITALGTLLTATNKLIPATIGEIVTPSNSVNLTNPSRAIYVGTGGNISLQMNGSAIVHSNVPSGTRLDVVATRVNLTGTTASNIVAWS